MSSKVSISDVLALSPEERISLVGDIWDSLTEIPERIELTDAQRRELDARLAGYRRDPHRGLPWSELRAKLLNKK